MELFRIFIFITLENLVFAQYCAYFLRKNCAIFIANCERQIAQSYAIKRMFLRIIGLSLRKTTQFSLQIVMRNMRNSAKKTCEDHLWLNLNLT